MRIFFFFFALGVTDLYMLVQWFGCFLISQLSKGRVFNLNNVTFQGKSFYCIMPEISLYSLCKTVCGLSVHLCGLSTGHLMPLW